MKRSIATVFILSLMVAACAKKASPTSSTNSAASTIAIATTDAVKSTDLAVLGKNVYDTRCGRCHGLKPVANYTPERWKEILTYMIPKAKLNDEESKQVTAYVNANAKK